jgi:glycosyltransferase involved in cell wall biosynthesis
MADSLKNEEIIYVANDWRGENKTSAHHIAEELSRSNRLLYVEAAGQRAPRASGRDLKKIFAKLAKAWSKPVDVAANVAVYSPLILPFHRYGIVRRINRVLLKFQLRRACRISGFRNPLLWIVLPHYSTLVTDVPNKGVVYYCVDEYSSQPNVEKERIQAMEKRVLENADVVFTVSDVLLEKKRQLNANAHLSPHGVDYEFFNGAADEATVVPDDIREIGRPIAGFFGLIEEWIDLDLIARAADALPDVSFVMIGSLAQPADSLKPKKNIHFLGHRKYELLPAYLKAFDVGLLPYKLNTQVINSNPKKLREYLAGGKPVVSVRVREVEKYGGMVEIVDSPDGFADAIRRSIDGDTAEMRQERIEAMREESWERKVDRIGRIVRERIPEVGS